MLCILIEYKECSKVCVCVCVFMNVLIVGRLKRYMVSSLVVTVGHQGTECRVFIDVVVVVCRRMDGGKDDGSDG